MPDVFRDRLLGQRPAGPPPPPVAGPSRFQPRRIRSIEYTGVTEAFLSELVLKALYLRGQATAYDLVETIKLPFYGVVEDLLRDLTNQELCFISRGDSMSPLSYSYSITANGQTRATEVANRNAYVGPAPVPLEEYCQAVAVQALESVHVSEDDMKAAFRNMAIDQEIFGQLGPAINSARSMFLFGPPGNGKTAIAETLVRMQGGAVYVPHAVAVGSEVVRVYDPVHHLPVSRELSGDHDDPRWILTKRPVVTVGGELTLPMLDLIYNDHAKFYEAPFQFKANNGAFFIDDFGRQQVSPHDLLNRWIVPLEKRIDFLTLRTGQKIEVPFDTLVMFSTNLEPRDLVDEAFLRRIRYKIEIKSPTPAQFKEIFQRVCAAKGIKYDDAVVDYLPNEKYSALDVHPRAVHPRDLLEQVVDYSSYRQIEPMLTRETMDISCHNYFVHL
ncbi:MAG: ATP-binding protein [Dehalococcoidia bacterium]|nr:ATP-binding protein [Dehalococcoidia bacterium]